jgi:RimJ/RimL family protein N-acetyltransferase
MSELTFADKPTLVGDRVMLRPVTEDDVDGLIELIHDPEVMRLTGSHPRPVDDEREFLRQWYATRTDHDDRLDLAIEDRRTGEYVGEVVLKDLDPDNRSCGFRIALSAARHFGKGYGGEATRMVLAHAFGLGVHRVGLEVYAFNPRARHVYETAGFVHEGTMRDALLWNGAWVDAHVMAALAPDASWRTDSSRRAGYSQAGCSWGGLFVGGYSWAAGTAPCAIASSICARSLPFG